MEQNETRTLWISIGAAIFAIVLLYGWAQDKRADYARKFGQTKTVVVATKDINEFALIDESMLEVVERPSDFIQPHAIDNPSEIIGQIALAPISKGEQVLNTKLVIPGKSTGLSMLVAPGKRAVTLPMDDIKSVSQLIRPGDRVDISAAVDDGKGLDKVRRVRTLFQDVPVLATGQSIVDNLPISIRKGEEDNYEIRNLRVDNNYKSLTVEVTPSHAQLLFHLLSTGSPIYLSLRNPNDRFVSPLKMADLDDVLNRVKMREPAKETKPVPVQPSKPAPKPEPKRGRFEKI